MTTTAQVEKLTACLAMCVSDDHDNRVTAKEACSRAWGGLQAQGSSGTILKEWIVADYRAIADALAAALVSDNTQQSQAALAAYRDAIGEDLRDEEIVEQGALEPLKRDLSASDESEAEVDESEADESEAEDA